MIAEMNAAPVLFVVLGALPCTAQGAGESVAKLPISATPPPKKKGGLGGEIAESKKEELTQTMQQAVALVKTYVPPNPAMIQRAVDAGKVSVEILQPGKVDQLTVNVANSGYRAMN
jgi:hypothetical protein